MIETPVVTVSEELDVAALRLKVPRAEIRLVMGPGLAEVHAVVAAQGIPSAGPWLTHHLEVHPDYFDFEICVPLVDSIIPAGRVRPARIPSQKVARAIHRGDYEQLADGWAELLRWIEAQGLLAAPDFYETYVIGPETSPSPAKWLTGLTRPLR